MVGALLIEPRIGETESGEPVYGPNLFASYRNINQGPIQDILKIMGTNDVLPKTWLDPEYSGVENRYKTEAAE